MTTADRIIANAEIAWKSISTYVVLAATAAGGWWLDQTPAAQAAFFAAHPILVGYGPWITGGVWLVSKLYPQSITTRADRQATDAALLEAVRRLLPAPALPQPAAPIPPAPPTPTAVVLEDLHAITQPEEFVHVIRQRFPGYSDAKLLAVVEQQLRPALPVAAT